MSHKKAWQGVVAGVVAGVALAMLAIEPAFAQEAGGLGEAMNRGVKEVAGGVNLVEAGAYLFAAIFGVGGVIALRKRWKDGGREELMVGVGGLIAAVLLLALPQFMQSGTKSAFGQNNLQLRPPSAIRP